MTTSSDDVQTEQDISPITTPEETRLTSKDNAGLLSSTSDDTQAKTQELQEEVSRMNAKFNEMVLYMNEKIGQQQDSQE